MNRILLPGIQLARQASQAAAEDLMLTASHQKLVEQAACTRVVPVASATPLLPESAEELPLGWHSGLLLLLC